MHKTSDEICSGANRKPCLFLFNVSVSRALKAQTCAVELETSVWENVSKAPAGLMWGAAADGLWRPPSAGQVQMEIRAAERNIRSQYQDMKASNCRSGLLSVHLGSEAALVFSPPAGLIDDYRLVPVVFRPSWRPRRPRRTSREPPRCCERPRRPSRWLSRDSWRRTTGSLTQPGRRC